MNQIIKSDLLFFIKGELIKLCGIQVSDDTSVLRSGLLDSIGLVELIVNVQNHFKLHIEIENLTRESFDTPKLMTSYFLEHST